MIVTSYVLMLRVLICIVVYQKASVGVHFILLYLFKERKKNQKQKEGIKFLKKRKKKWKRKKNATKIELFSCFIFNKRLEENKKVVSGLA